MTISFYGNVKLFRLIKIILKIDTQKAKRMAFYSRRGLGRINMYFCFT